MMWVTWSIIAIVIAAAMFVYWRQILPGNKIDQPIVSGDLDRIKSELEAHPEMFKPRISLPLHLAANRSQGKVVRLLVEHGVDANTKDAGGNNPLHKAVWSHRNLEIVEYLISHGADINCRNKFGWTPLDEARHRKKSKMVDLLLRLGAAESTDE